DYISYQYLNGPVNRYETRVYLFDVDSSRLYNIDTTSFTSLKYISETAIPTNNFLFYRDNATQGHAYLSYIPLRDSVGKIHGHAFIDFILKKSANESVYPELLQPGRDKDYEAEMKYGVYQDDQLLSQSQDFPFPDYLPRDKIAAAEFLSDKEDQQIFRYRTANKREVVIVYPRNELIEIITLFSYLLGLFIVFAILAMLLRITLSYTLRKDSSYRIIQLTLRKRIHFAMLSLVLLSFLIIGGVTIWFFIDQYDTSNRTKLQTVMQTAERSVQQFIKDKKMPADPSAFNTLTDSVSFKYLVTNLSSNHGIDVNIYNSLGSLKLTSQDDIYSKFILDRIMMPDAYYHLSRRGSASLIQEEAIGRLKYLSSYIPVRVGNGQTVGYINIPFFASQKELNFQISNILVALINLYAFIFLLSSILTVFITNWLTRTLHLIISKFENFNLQRNELLEWPYDDEIGLLIREYNKMVGKVEEHAALLAQSEREGAWREMARQVAHEIKNPLTPMKLNIQYLQQALKNNHPNARQLTEHVAASMIEQIDNLSHIATAFSDFARMPEAVPETVELNELLLKAVELYLNNSNVTVRFEPKSHPVNVFIDRNQLVRVSTNLIQNAIQAIPENRQGSVMVTLSTSGANAIIAVTDNGSGITAETAAKIFSPYFTTKGSGTGLGLAMTKKIIESWSGRIWFETRLDEGTTFFMELPLFKDHQT
ncbi:MAG: GHKL domain-containing protein, partial [Pedobacter sp.]